MIPLTHQQPSLEEAQVFVSLSTADYRRVTFLTGWIIALLYVLCDLGLRWGLAQGNATALWLSGLFGQYPLVLALVFVFSAVGIWLLFYAIDDTLGQPDQTGLLNRLGQLEHLRVFVLVLLVALVGAGALAAWFRVASMDFWLLLALQLVCCGTVFIEEGAALGRRLGRGRDRLTLLFARLPLVGRLVNTGGIRLGSRPAPPTGAPEPDPSAAAAAAPAQPQPAPDPPAQPPGP